MDTLKATTSVKRCCTTRRRHKEVWPGTVTVDAPRVTLAGYSRASKLQAGSANFTGVCSVRRQYTYQTVALQSPKSPHGGIRSAARHQLTVLTVGAHLLSLVRRRSTLCQMICEISQSAQHWRRIFSLPVNKLSALGVSHVMRYII